MLFWSLRSGPPDWRYALNVKAVKGGTVPIGGYAYVYVPPGALSQDAVVSMRRLDHDRLEPSGDDGVTSVGDPFEVVIGAEFDIAALVSARYDRALLAQSGGTGEVAMAKFEERQGRWVTVPSEVNPEFRTVSTRATANQTAWMPVASRH